MRHSVPVDSLCYIEEQLLQGSAILLQFLTGQIGANLAILTGIAHYEGKDITLNNGNTYNNLVMVDNTSDLDELEEDLDAFIDGEYDGKIATLSIDSETKFYNTMQIGATEVEERRARKKGGDVDDAGISVKQWGRIKILNMKLQQAKIDLSSKGTHVVSVAQEVEIKDDDGKKVIRRQQLDLYLV